MELPPFLPPLRTAPCWRLQCNPTDDFNFNIEALSRAQAVGPFLAFPIQLTQGTFTKPAVHSTSSLSGATIPCQMLPAV